MPAILNSNHYDWWIETDRFKVEFVRSLLRPYPPEEMESLRVSSLVNSARNDSPECLKPAQ
jgi:putative SOS response-associated peptidase YedK